MDLLLRVMVPIDRGWMVNSFAGGRRFKETLGHFVRGGAWNFGRNVITAALKKIQRKKSEKDLTTECSSIKILRKNDKK